MLQVKSEPLPPNTSDENLVENLQANFYSGLSRQSDPQVDEDHALALKLQQEEILMARRSKPSTNRTQSVGDNINQSGVSVKSDSNKGVGEIPDKQELDAEIYFGEIGRKTAEGILFGLGFDGFLIRYSPNVTSFTLSKYECKQNKFTHIIIKKVPNGYRLENSFDTHLYPTLKDLVIGSNEFKGFKPAGRNKREDRV